MNNTIAKITLHGFLIILLADVSFGDNKKMSLATFQPTVKSVAGDFIEVTMGRNAGVKYTVIDAQGTSKVQPASNIRKFKVTSTTTIAVDGLKCELKDIRPGMVVNIVQGMDRDSVQSIDAHTLPPPLPSTAPTTTGSSGAAPKPPQTPTGNKGTSFIKPFHTISQNQILTISEKIITEGEPGTHSSKAYRLNSYTAVFVNKSLGKLADLKVGMNVEISSNDGTIATEIRACDKPVQKQFPKPKSK